MISGFLLYRPFVAAALGGCGGVAVGPFFWRRALRIFPAYWVAAATIALVFGVNAWTGLGDAVLHLALVHIYDADTVVSGPISQAWSLGTEISFYAALPLVALAARTIANRTGRRVGPQVALVVFLIGGSLLYRWVIFEHAGANASAMSTWLPGFLDQFGLGMLLAIASVAVVDRGHEPRVLRSSLMPAVSWLLAFAALSAAAFVVDLPTSSLDYTVGQQMGKQVTYGLWGFFLVLPAVFGPQDRDPVRWVLRNPIARWLGLISYGIYLWHQLFLDRYFAWTDTQQFTGGFGRALAFAIAGAIVAATLSYLLLERPILRLKDHPPRLRRRGGREQGRPGEDAGLGSAADVAP